MTTTNAVPARTKLSAPRLQLRWEKIERGPATKWLCHYELVVPLGEYDIRAEQEGPRGGRRPNLTEMVVVMGGPTERSGGGTPCTDRDGTLYCDPPYRDGAHAQWDAKALGNLPIYVIAPDGRAIQYEPLDQAGTTTTSKETADGKQ